MDLLKKLVVLSGAGISAESGIDTFRSINGLWANHRIEDVASPEAWKRNPSLVQEFYNARRKQILEVNPNQAHLFLAELENHFDVQIVTQNIDDLHERAGSTNVLHLHGNIRFSKSSGPKQEKKYYRIEGWELKSTDLCDDAYPLRPHVVWFGEAVPEFERAAEICKNADILLVIGTSLQVYPAASLAFLSNKSCLKMIVDPHTLDIQDTDAFLHIKHTAVESIQKLKQILKV